MTGWHGPDKCIDAVGAESDATASFDAVLDKAKAAVLLGTDRPHVLLLLRPAGERAGYGLCSDVSASGLDWLQNPAHLTTRRIDPRRIVIIGRSMGRFVAAHATAELTSAARSAALMRIMPLPPSMTMLAQARDYTY